MRQDGYTLVGMLIAVAVINIAMSVALVSWRSVDRRAREAELIFRGEHIARAIECHRQLSPTEPAEELEDLVEANCLRRVYRDPMARDGQWRILRQQDLADGTIQQLLGQAQPGAAGADPSSGAGGFPASPDTASSASRLGGSLSIGGRGQAGGQRTGPFSQAFGPAGSGPAGAGGKAIIGVMSTTEGPATRVYRGETTYERWLFLAGQS